MADQRHGPTIRHMHLFTCPHCGPRDETEFLYAGDDGKMRPGRSANDEAWAAYRFFRKNLKGEAREYWRHTHGCGQYFAMTRDTVTHTVSDRP
jgi:sarcosine oxidase, subunit delta